MANYQAIMAVCEAVVQLLRTSDRPFDNELEFEIYAAKDFSKQQAMTAGASLFLYRIFPNGTNRMPSGRLGPTGQHYPTQLPLDLHFMHTAWGQNASLQHTIVGWMMRILEDTPILPPSFLNAVAPGMFRLDETVEVSLAELTTEDMLCLSTQEIESRYLCLTTDYQGYTRMSILRKRLSGPIDSLDGQSPP